MLPLNYVAKMAKIIATQCSVGLLVLAGLAWAPAAFCGQINVGDIFFIDNGNGTIQFYLDNFTGPNVGCSTPGGFPVRTDLNIGGNLPADSMPTEVAQEE